jgi:hypothetical protein
MGHSLKKKFISLLIKTLRSMHHALCAFVFTGEIRRRLIKRYNIRL